MRRMKHQAHVNLKETPMYYGCDSACIRVIALMIRSSASCHTVFRSLCTNQVAKVALWQGMERVRGSEELGSFM